MALGRQRNRQPELLVTWAEMPTMLSYYAEQKLASPEARREFGTTGAIEGVARPEAANNAAAAGILVPMLTLSRQP